MSKCGVIQVHSEAFSHTPKLTILDLSFNNIKFENDGVSFLRHLTKLKELNLSDMSYFGSFPADMFIGLDILERLNLSRNGFGELHIQMFRSLRNLVELDMSFCHLTSIHPDAFSHTPKLIKLNLSHNNLKIQNAHVFRHLTNLKELNLSFNNLRYLDIENSIISELLSLKLLNLILCKF